MCLKRSYDFIIRFYALLVCGHYFLQNGFMQILIFHLYFWKTSFLSFCDFYVFCLFYVEFNVISIKFITFLIIVYNQGITVRQRVIRFAFVLSSSLFLCTFFIFHSCTLFILHLFSCCFILHFFFVALIWCLTSVSLVFIMINKLNADQALIQIRRLEKVQHIDNAQRSQTDGRTVRYTLVCLYRCQVLCDFVHFIKTICKTIYCVIISQSVSRLVGRSVSQSVSQSVC